MPDVNSESEINNVPFKEEDFADDNDKDSLDNEAFNIPPKDRKLVTHPYDFIVRSLNDQIADGTLILADQYERRQVWDNTKCSRLIESLLMNVPIPICYFAELETGQYSVIDGQQRLSAIHRFLNNEYSLRGLRIRDELNGKRFHQLDTEEQRLIKSRALRVIIVLKESHPDIRFDVFERLNTTSVKLSTQELRNCIFRGALNDLIKELSQHPTFQYIRNVCEPDLRMRDIEMILRFFAFYERLPLYSGNLKKFLDDYQKDGMKRNKEDLDKLKSKFIDIIEDVKFVFGNDAFRRYDPEHGTWERSVNRAVYDAVMICFAKASSDEIRAHRDNILNGFMNLCTNNIEFNDAITSSTKDRAKVKNRIIKFREMMQDKGISIGELAFWNGD